MLFQFIKGFSYAFSGFQLIHKKGVKRFVAIPLLINIAVFASLFFFGAHLLEDSTAHLEGWWAWLEWLLWPLYALFSLVVTYFAFILLANIISSPFNGPLSFAVEQHLSQKSIDDIEASTWVGEIKKALYSELQKIIYYLPRAIPCFLVGFIPGLQIVWLFFTAWILALEYMDFPLSNHGFNFRKGKDIMLEHRSMATGFGLACVFFTIIPLLNFVAIPVAIAGATKLWLNEIKPMLEQKTHSLTES